jgi:outer membrane lipoprotein-sorting protein
MIRFLTLAAAACVLVVPLGCRAFEDAMLAHILRNQAKIESYRGTIVERGLVPEGELRSEVAFEKPDRVLIRATGPDLYRERPWSRPAGR